MLERASVSPCKNTIRTGGQEIDSGGVAYKSSGVAYTISGVTCKSSGGSLGCLSSPQRGGGVYGVALDDSRDSGDTDWVGKLVDAPDTVACKEDEGSIRAWGEWVVSTATSTLAQGIRFFVVVCVAYTYSMTCMKLCGRCD